MDYQNINDYEQLYLISENNDMAEEIIFKKYSPIVYSIASKQYQLFVQKGIDLDDLVQEGFLGLSNAIKSFKEEENTLFYTFCVVCITRQIRAYCRQYTSMKNEVLNTAYSIDSNILEEDDTYIFDPMDSAHSIRNPDTYIISEFTFKKLIQFKHSLPLLQSLVFELRYNGFRYKEIANLLDLSVSSVDHYLHLCKNKFRLEFQIS